VRFALVRPDQSGIYSGVNLERSCTYLKRAILEVPMLSADQRMDFIRLYMSNTRSYLEHFILDHDLYFYRQTGWNFGESTFGRCKYTDEEIAEKLATELHQFALKTPQLRTEQRYALAMESTNLHAVTFRIREAIEGISDLGIDEKVDLFCRIPDDEVKSKCVRSGTIYTAQIQYDHKVAIWWSMSCVQAKWNLLEVFDHMTQLRMAKSLADDDLIRCVNRSELDVFDRLNPKVQTYVLSRFIARDSKAAHEQFIRAMGEPYDPPC
jgi:hypothetical protein